MRRRDLLLAAAPLLVAPGVVSAEPQREIYETFRASLSDGRRITCYRGLAVLLERCWSHCLPVIEDGTLVGVSPYVVRVEKYNHETCAWEFHAGRRATGWLINSSRQSGTPHAQGQQNEGAES